MAANRLFSVDPSTLVTARQLSHLACQWPSRAARANLPAAKDDSHSNLGWVHDRDALVSRLLGSEQPTQLGFCFADQSLVMLEDGEVRDRLELVGATEATVQIWVDAQLESVGLQLASGVEMPYEIIVEPRYSEFVKVREQAVALGMWYARAQAVLSDLVDGSAIPSVIRPRIRCWPHHFDLATLFVLEHGDPETSRSIGVGLSPGDSRYAEPYFYCTPWPAPAAEALPLAPAPLAWHTDEFVSLIVRASGLTEQPDLRTLLTDAMQRARQVLD